MGKEWTTVEVLSHTRHDWLNKLQLIKGNLSLNKVERVKEIIDEIVIEAQQETLLTNLKVPQFAALLLTYNWENHPIHLDYEIAEITLHKKELVDDNHLTQWTNLFLGELKSAVKAFHENYLTITIEQQREGIRFFFDFSGIITEKAQLLLFLEQQSSIEKKVQECSEQELALEVFFPYVK